MDERRRHVLSGQNLPAMEYDINLYHRNEAFSYVDQIMQRDRNEPFTDRTTQSASAYGSYSSGSYFGNHGHQGSPYTNWQHQARDPSSMYIPQTYPDYSTLDQSRFVNSQAVGPTPYCGFEGYGHPVNRTPIHPSQPFPSNGNTVDSRQSSWNGNTYCSGQATAQESQNCPTTCGTPGSNIGAMPAQIPSEISQGTVVNNYSASSEIPVHDRSIKDPYHVAADRRSTTSMNYGPASGTLGPNFHLVNNKSCVGLPSAQNYPDTPQPKPVSHLQQSVNNFIDGSCPLPAFSEQVKDMTNVDHKQHEPHHTADHHNIGQTKAKARTEHSFPCSSEKLALSSEKDNVPTCDSLITECIVTGDNQKECPGSQEVLEHPTKLDVPADTESVERIVRSEEISSKCESKQKRKMESNDDIVKSLPDLGGSRNTSSDFPVSANPSISNACVDSDDAGQRFQRKEDKSQQNKDSQRDNLYDHSNVKESSISKSTPMTVRTTVDLSGSELGCSTVVKFEDGTCKYIKREATDEKEEETFFCSSQHDGGHVLEPKMESCQENNHTGTQGEDIATGNPGENSLTVVRQEIKQEQQHLENDDPDEKCQEKDKVKMEVEDETGSSSRHGRDVPDTSQHSAVPLKAQGVHSVMECNYDSDDWEVGSDKQMKDEAGSVQLDTAPGVVDGGTFERCPQCNELISSDDMIEHPFKCKSKSNTPTTLMDLPPDLRPPSDDAAPMKCQECGVGFQITEDLVMHLRIHDMLAKNAHAQKMQEENQMMVMAEEMEKQMTNLGDITEELSGECEVCYETFTDPTMVPYHKVMHQQFPFHCRKCNLFFSTLTELHKSRCSDQKRHKVFKYRCMKCKGALLDSFKMQKHRKRCEGKMETCRLCQKKFPSFRQLAHHAEICNEDRTKKDNGDDIDQNRIDVVVEENGAEVGAPDLESVVQEHADQALVDHASTDNATDYHITADHKAADYKAADQVHGKSSASKHYRTLQSENNSSNEESYEQAVREPSKKKRKKEKDGGETCGACGKQFKNFKKLEKHAARCDGVRNQHDSRACSETQQDNEYQTTADHKPADYKPADQAVTYNDSSLGVQLVSRPVQGDIRESSSIKEEHFLGDGMRPLENFVETNLTLQPSEEYNSEVRCKGCERELPKSHKRACKETLQYCKSCLNMVRTKNLSPCGKSSASKHKRTLRRESSSSNEKSCDNNGGEPSKKKQKKERDGGETCGACGKWFKNFEKLEKHAARCDGVKNQQDRGACSETQPDNDINLDWKYPTVHRCPKCNKKFVKEKKLKKHVKSCMWIQEDSPTKSNALLDDESDQEDELPLSSLKNMNGAVAADSSCKDDVGHIRDTLPLGTMESSKNSKVELVFDTASVLKNVDQGHSDEAVSDVSKKIEEENREEVCATIGSMPSHQKDIPISEYEVVVDGAIHEQSDRKFSIVVSASGLAQKALPQEFDSDVDEHSAESKELAYEIETSQKSKCDERIVNETETLISSAQQGAFDESENDTSTSQPAIVVPVKCDLDSTSSSYNMMAQQPLASEENTPGTLLEENVTLSSSPDIDLKEDVQPVALTKHNKEMNILYSSHSVPQEKVNADICSAAAAASSLTAGVELKEDYHVMKKSLSTCVAINQEDLSTLVKQTEGVVSYEGGGDSESYRMEQGDAKSEEIQQVTCEAKAPPVVNEIAEPQAKTSLDDEYAKRSVSQSSSGLQEVCAAQARPTTALTHQEAPQAVSFPESSLNTTQTSFKEMSGLEGKDHFPRVKEKISVDSSMEVEYTLGLENVKNISLECEAIPGHHCVYCAAEFPSRNDLWKHARDCRDNHLKVIAYGATGPKENQVVQKPVSNVPWQVQNDYTKKEAMMMKSEIGIDLNCVIPAVGYRPPPNKPEQEPLKKKKRKKKQKSKVKEDKEKEKRRKIERKKRRERERLREKLRVQAKLEQLEQKSVKKFKGKEQQRTFTCELCDQSFHSKEKFEKHKVSHVSTSYKKTLAVCVEKLKVGEIEDHKISKLKIKHPGADKLKEKENSIKKHSEVVENQSVKKKIPKISKKKPPGKEEDEEVFVDVESLNDTAQPVVKINLSAKTSQTIEKHESVQTFGHLTTSSGSLEGIQQADGTNCYGKPKGTTWKKNEFGVQFPVVIEVECPDCQMKFSHQSTLDRHRRLHRK